MGEHKAIGFLTLAVASIFSLVSLSLSLYLIPIVIESASMRIVLQDVCFLFLVVLMISLLRCKGRRLAHNWLFATSLCSIAALAVLSFVNSLVLDKYPLVQVLRESRLVLYFLVFLSVWSTADVECTRTPTHRFAEKIVLVMMLSSVVGTALYTAIGYFLLSGNSELSGSTREFYFPSFGLVFGGKYKSTPYVVAFVQTYLLQRIITEKTKRVLWALSMITILTINLYVAFFSNMRSIIGAWLFGSFIAVAGSFRSKRTGDVRKGIVSRRVIRAALVVILLVMVSVFLTRHLKVSSDRFVSQVIAKRVGTSDIGRIFVLQEVFGFVLKPFIGRGLGSGSEVSVIWPYSINPIDSAFFHITLAFGYPFLLFYLLLLGSAILSAVKILLADVHGSRRKRTPLVLSVLAAFMVFVLSHFNDSHLLMAPDAAFAGMILGMVVALGRDTIGKRQFVEHTQDFK